jgi:hypothetical protein
MKCPNTYVFWKTTSVACAIGPSVNTLRAQLNFPSKLNFCKLFEFLTTKSFKIQYLPQLSSENCEVNFIKFDSSSAFQQHQECFQIPIQFSVLILFYFHWKNGSIINSFLKTPRVRREAPWFGRSQGDKTKQNRLACFIERFLLVKGLLIFTF